MERGREEERMEEESQVQAEEDERRGAPLKAPTAPGAHSGGAGGNTAQIRLPGLIYRHYVGQR